MDRDAPLDNRAVLDCMAPMLPFCVENRCTCIPPPPHSVPGEPVQPTAQCMVKIGFTTGRPDQPWIQADGGACAASVEIAIAFALATFLRASGPPAAPPATVPFRETLRP